MGDRCDDCRTRRLPVHPRDDPSDGLVVLQMEQSVDEVSIHREWRCSGPAAHIGRFLVEGHDRNDDQWFRFW